MYVRKPSYRGGFQGGEGTRVEPDGRLADDGKRIYAMDVLGTCDSLYKVGVGGRDGTWIFDHPRLADDGKRI